MSGFEVIDTDVGPHGRDQFLDVAEDTSLYSVYGA